MNLEIFDIFECWDHRSRFEAKVSFFNRTDFKDFSFFSQILDSLSSRDDGKFNFENDLEERFEFTKKTQETEFQRFMNSSEQMDIVLTIDKKIIDGKQSIYFFDSFIKHLIGKQVAETMSYFHNLFSNECERIFFEILDPNISEFNLHTGSIYFGTSSSESDNRFNRISKLFKVKNASSFYNLDNYELLPDDFHVSTAYPKNDSTRDLKKYFKKIEMILSIIYVSASSRIDERRLYYQINDVANTHIVSLNNDLAYNPVIFEIYNWIYSTDSYIDKSSIARSVFEYLAAEIIDSDDSVIRGIQKAYNIYIKDKVSVYLDAKKELSSYIIESLSSLKRYPNAILDTFLKNLYAISGFFFSVILANVISERELDKIFTNDILVIIIIALIGSFIFWGISNYKFSVDLQNFKDIFKTLKNNYREVLLDNELDTIFGNIKLDDEIIKVKIFKKKVNCVWGSLLFISMAVTIIVLLKGK